LTFAYTGTLESSRLKEQELVLLLSACHKSEGLQKLIYECEKQLKAALTPKNMHQVLKAVNEHKLSFKIVVLHFILENYSDFISNKTANTDIGIDLFHEVVEIHELQTAGKVEALPKVEEPKDHFKDEFKALYDSTKNFDITFKVNEANKLGLSGQLHKLHKAILVGRAPGLNTLINLPAEHPTKGQAVTPLKGISPDAFEALVKWVYYDDVNISTLVACELVHFCQLHSIGGLQKICVEIMKGGVTVDSVLIIMNTASLKDMPAWFVEEMAALRPQCVKYAVEHLAEVDLDKLKGDAYDRSIAHDILLAVQTRAKEGAKPETLKKSKKERKVEEQQEKKAEEPKEEKKAMKLPDLPDLAIHVTDSK